ncbi:MULTISPECIES: hypothetical protein [unclassified Mesorhizobium]|uniref:hypothetical protein n=1 Tax=unclassified Mesorhizobium TaxID=325217 RepID=UPI001FDFD107|nr:MULTISPECIES: hypothetical protein [unclassified Mesorhizobium]
MSSEVFTIERQISAMADRWPQLVLATREGASATWRGPLRPLLQTFQVEITFRAPSIIEKLNNRRMQPRVKILTPQLRPRRGDPEGQLPHVYYIGCGPLDVVLCMFDPDSDEWSPFMSVAETTVPWAIDWLTSYEGWRATGTWTGTGKHIEQPRAALGSAVNR